MYWLIVCSVKAAQMNVHRSLIRELMLHKFELGNNMVEATKNSTVNRWFKKFHWGCKNLNDLARWGRLKTVYSEGVVQAIEANQVSLASHCLVWFVTFTISTKVSGVFVELFLTLAKYCKTLDTP